MDFNLTKIMVAIIFTLVQAKDNMKEKLDDLKLIKWLIRGKNLRQATSKKIKMNELGA
jgi:hypothetical protein